jgi:hypothetical protein
MKFRNLRGPRPYSSLGRMIEVGDIVGDGGVIDWDGAVDPLLEPVDDEARQALAQIRNSMRDPTAVAVDPAREDVYRAYGEDMLRTGIDPTRYRP